MKRSTASLLITGSFLLTGFAVNAQQKTAPETKPLISPLYLVVNSNQGIPGSIFLQQ